MKLVKVFGAAILMLAFSKAGAQSADFSKPDKTAQCKNLKEGKFLRENYPEVIWYMTVKDNVQTEYFNNGKDFIKSTLVFVDDCNYKAIVTEKSDKNDPVQIGDVFSTKIMQTQGNFLKVQTKIENNQFELTYIKVK
ncbi:hypothetical protein [Chryseobacterium indologenes]|uniref:Lipocalin-like domain-containing protein n=1 Tax=Chryseobacterium indologenes TaxID=253 RepID=A0A0N0ZU33_CHRID|nr:hypothetical protein [Chryseobacterium indologenes]KPE50698.1 hypothetical protein AOB46_12970 [Chryseobacterium indologenes]